MEKRKRNGGYHCLGRVGKVEESDGKKQFFRKTVSVSMICTHVHDVGKLMIQAQDRKNRGLQIRWKQVQTLLTNFITGSI